MIPSTRTRTSSWAVSAKDFVRPVFSGVRTGLLKKGVVARHDIRMQTS